MRLDTGVSRYTGAESDAAPLQDAVADSVIEELAPIFNVPEETVQQVKIMTFGVLAAAREAGLRDAYLVISAAELLARIGEGADAG